MDLYRVGKGSIYSSGRNHGSISGRRDCWWRVGGLASVWQRYLDRYVGQVTGFG